MTSVTQPVTHFLCLRASCSDRIRARANNVASALQVHATTKLLENHCSAVAQSADVSAVKLRPVGSTYFQTPRWSSDPEPPWRQLGLSCSIHTQVPPAEEEAAMTSDVKLSTAFWCSLFDTWCQLRSPEDPEVTVREAQICTRQHSIYILFKLNISMD